MLIRKLYLVKLVWIIKLLILVLRILILFFKLLLRKIVMGIFLYFYEVKMGFSNLVNKYGVDDKLKGKIVNWKYLIILLLKF